MMGNSFGSKKDKTSEKNSLIKDDARHIVRFLSQFITKVPILYKEGRTDIKPRLTNALKQI